MTVAYLGLGANLGNAPQTLKDAVIYLAQQVSIITLVESSLYRTAPVNAYGNDFYNCVVKIDTILAIRQLLALCHSIENYFGRERLYQNSPRTLDIDILLYGTVQLDRNDLTVPHPRLIERAFALVPLLELESAIEIPNLARADYYLSHVASQRIEKITSTNV
ncbi:2-amino-4-hydroxy-6-hydroxymethyldihydropteridine diphosphokinase [Candidatus Vallotia lariciata]|uniref:2-amino-4-hydroxy-6- hydroxymethyldihydropteridine diphosphokinase n=1 Tax=Candidatus Vallotia laricis TaxID=2018052 RepID=UPI001D00E5E2|nr:2-amino-4-hydroxy-6-hydroxymethyldihydropteridine diphosphokinase [Candidatus Vallotia lariciata]UDG82856.1 2-amino-4-hydroxy-6-hydroxymethyldihydropteridine pyrophosphokinase [Candidatus Vallotia lariciata]